MLLDGTRRSEINLRNMLYYDVTNGLARRNWAGNPGARFSVEREMDRAPALRVTLPNHADDDLINSIF